MEVELELPGHPDSVRRARRAAGSFGDHLSGRRLEDLRLLVSEVVTNAIRHSGAGPEDSIGLRIAAMPSRVRVEVSDRGNGFTPGGVSLDPARPSGWGLFLVAELADRWGVEGDERTLVWFELA